MLDNYRAGNLVKRATNLPVIPAGAIGHCIKETAKAKGSNATAKATGTAKAKGGSRRRKIDTRKRKNKRKN